MKKISRSARKHIQGAQEWRAGIRWGAGDQNKFRTAAKGEARRAAAAPGGPSRIARGSGRAGFLLKFRFGASFTRISRTTNPLLRRDGKRWLPPWASPSLHAPRNNRARVAQARAAGCRAARGGGGGRQAGPELRAGAPRGGAGGCPLSPCRARAFSLALGYSCRSILPDVNSFVFARQWLL